MAGVVNCPKCGSGDVEAIGFTWWGGVVGPRLIHHARCKACGATYNGRTGRSNNAAVAGYCALGVAIVVALVVAAFLLRGA